MKKLQKLVALVLVVAVMMIGSSAVFAAPTNGAAQATQHSANSTLFQHFQELLTAIWGTAIWGGDGTAIWG
jgi:hypothetical protein